MTVEALAFGRDEEGNPGVLLLPFIEIAICPLRSYEAALVTAVAACAATFMPLVFKPETMV